MQFRYQVAAYRIPSWPCCTHLDSTVGVFQCFCHCWTWPVHSAVHPTRSGHVWLVMCMRLVDRSRRLALMSRLPECSAVLSWASLGLHQSLSSLLGLRWLPTELALGSTSVVKHNPGILPVGRQGLTLHLIMLSMIFILYMEKYCKPLPQRVFYNEGKHQVLSSNYIVMFEYQLNAVCQSEILVIPRFWYYFHIYVPLSW